MHLCGHFLDEDLRCLGAIRIGDLVGAEMGRSERVVISFLGNVIEVNRDKKWPGHICHYL